MDGKITLLTVLSSVAAFVGAASLSAGCVGNCNKYCDDFDPEIQPGLYDVDVYGEDATAHYASELSEVEITDDQVRFRYVDLSGAPAEVVWDIVGREP